ncbi:sorting nexin-16 [Alosa pseudoharengus]|uniref:sorting nexin-16 n=1 Tax=Alosa pseudoharengus TaxID=34774 RepID=UPI003F8B8DFC
MASSFVPVAVPVKWALSRPGSSRSVESLSSSPGSPRCHSPWTNGGAISCPPSVPFPPLGTQRGFERSSGVFSNVESSSLQEDWEDRPPTPTLLGYEVMEERSKFTVYKILVRRTPDESWVVFRRYTDFSRLNDKLKEMLPRFKLSLPPKRWFRDNYDMSFLEERQLGLQTFLQNLVAFKDITNSEAVRAFLCLDDPPSPFDSLEESRAFCETLEETNHRLQRELVDKHRQTESLKKILEEKDLKISLLEKAIDTGVAVSPLRHCQPLIYSESSTDCNTEEKEDTEKTLPSPGQRRHTQSCEIQTPGKAHRAYWYGPASGSPIGPYQFTSSP